MHFTIVRTSRKSRKCFAVRTNTTAHLTNVHSTPGSHSSTWLPTFPCTQSSKARQALRGQVESVGDQGANNGIYIKISTKISRVLIKALYILFLKPIKLNKVRQLARVSMAKESRM